MDFSKMNILDKSLMTLIYAKAVLRVNTIFPPPLAARLREKREKMKKVTALFGEDDQMRLADGIAFKKQVFFH